MLPENSLVDKIFNDILFRTPITKRNTKGYVYFITDDTPSKFSKIWVKIGRTSNIKKRISQLQTGSSSRLQLLGSIKSDDCYYMERNFHRKLKHSRVRGEWFALSYKQLSECLLLCD